MEKVLTIKYTPVFLRKLKKLESALQEEVFEKIELFSNTGNRNVLKVHKLNGELAKCHSFSVNYKTRVVF